MRRRTVVALTLLALVGIAGLTSPAWRPTALDRISRAQMEEPSARLLESDERPVLTGSAAAERSRRGSAPAPPLSTGAKPVTTDDVTAVSLRVETVDAHTGSGLRGRWSVDTPRFRLRAEGSVDVSAALVRHVELRETLLLRSGEGKPNALPPTHVVDTPLDLDVPTGYVSLVGGPRLTFHRAAGVRETWALAPLVREAVLDVRIFGPGRIPADGARVLAVEVGGALRGVDAEQIGRGEIRLRGIPFLPGEPVHLGLAWDPEGPPPPARELTVQEILEETEEVVETGLRRRDASTRVPDDLGTPWSLVVRLPGPLPLVKRDTIETDNDLPYAESIEVVAGQRRRAVPVRVRALDDQGRPIVGGHVGGHRTNEDGEAIVDAKEGSFTLRVEGPGRFPMTLATEVVFGRENEVTLREPRGARLEVLVTDEEGRPRACARLTVTGKVFDVEDGVQRVDLFTDHRGRRTLARVEPGVRAVRAFWGSRDGSEQVELADGETRRLTIVAK